ncbi:MAG: SxtJ family membrane protein [Blastocatellia bacterium]|nr:SxtJ family membrane protein [Blastocatellia bacterium]
MQSKQQTKKTSFRAEREFGLLVGAVFLALGSWWLYKGRWPNVATAFAGVGALLMFFGLVFPKALVLPNRAWMGLAGLMAMVTTPILLGAIFFLIVMPIGVFKRATGWDPLRRRAPAGPSYWTAYNPRQRDPKHFEKMY